MLVLRPWPPAGECMCAASPARNTRPSRNRSASAVRGRKPEAQCTRPSADSGRWVRAATIRRTPSGEVSGSASFSVPASALPSALPSAPNWANSWNAVVLGNGQSRSGPPGAFGQTCQFPRSRPSISRSATRAGRGSTCSPAIGMPTDRRTVERPPSAATR